MSCLHRGGVYYLGTCEDCRQRYLELHGERYRSRAQAAIDAAVARVRPELPAEPVQEPAQAALW